MWPSDIEDRLSNAEAGAAVGVAVGSVLTALGAAGLLLDGQFSAFWVTVAGLFVAWVSIICYVAWSVWGVGHRP